MSNYRDWPVTIAVGAVATREGQPYVSGGRPVAGSVMSRRTPGAMTHGVVIVGEGDRALVGGEATSYPAVGRGGGHLLAPGVYRVDVVRGARPDLYAVVQVVRLPDDTDERAAELCARKLRYGPSAPGYVVPGETLTLTAPELRDGATPYTCPTCGQQHLTTHASPMAVAS